MTSVLAVALAVSTCGIAGASTLAGGAHSCCLRLASHCPTTALQCCAMDQNDRTPAPVPETRVLAAPPATAPSSSVVVVTAAGTRSAPPVALVRYLTAPPLLYLHYSTLLV